MARTSKVDWDSLETEYRKGMRSLRDIGEQYGITESAIRRKAKLDGWDRDLSSRINAKTEALVLKKEHKERVAKGEAEDTDEGAVVSAGEVRADAVWQERKDIKKARSVVASLFDELEQQLGDNVELLNQLGELMRAENDKGQDQLNDIYRKVISLPGRTDTAKKLVEALEKSISLERRVLRIQDDSNFEDMAKAAAGTIMSAADAYKRMLEG